MRSALASDSRLLEMSVRAVSLEQVRLLLENGPPELAAAKSCYAYLTRALLKEVGMCALIMSVFHVNFQLRCSNFRSHKEQWREITVKWSKTLKGRRRAYLNSYGRLK